MRKFLERLTKRDKQILFWLACFVCGVLILIMAVGTYRGRLPGIRSIRGPGVTLRPLTPPSWKLTPRDSAEIRAFKKWRDSVLRDKVNY